mmetsp:Transcript_4996/g.9397  ORF Transcript_4996/g.9397 Transcript_4996/m.9397 type:complete len:291 (-) Transcript_4996:240-1112(-)
MCAVLEKRCNNSICTIERCQPYLPMMILQLELRVLPPRCLHRFFSSDGVHVRQNHVLIFWGEAADAEGESAAQRDAVVPHPRGQIEHVPWLQHALRARLPALQNAHHGALLVRLRVIWVVLGIARDGPGLGPVCLQQKHVVVVAVSTNAAAFWAVADHDVSESPPWNEREQVHQIGHLRHLAIHALNQQCVVRLWQRLEVAIVKGPVAQLPGLLSTLLHYQTRVGTLVARQPCQFLGFYRTDKVRDRLSDNQRALLPVLLQELRLKCMLKRELGKHLVNIAVLRFQGRLH